MKRRVGIFGAIGAIIVMALALASCTISVGNGANGGWEDWTGGTSYFAPLQGVGKMVSVGLYSACGETNGWNYSCHEHWMFNNTNATGFEAGLWNDTRTRHDLIDYLVWLAKQPGSVNIPNTLPCVLIEENNWTFSVYVSIIWPGNAWCRFNDYA